MAGQAHIALYVNRERHHCAIRTLYVGNCSMWDSIYIHKKAESILCNAPQTNVIQLQSSYPNSYHIISCTIAFHPIIPSSHLPPPLRQPSTHNSLPNQKGQRKQDEITSHNIPRLPRPITIKSQRIQLPHQLLDLNHFRKLLRQQPFPRILLLFQLPCLS